MSNEWAGMAVDDQGEREQELAREANQLSEEGSDLEEEEEEEYVRPPPRQPATAAASGGRPKRKRRDYEPSDREMMQRANERAVRSRMEEAIYKRQLINRIKNWQAGLRRHVDPIIGDKNLEKMKIHELETLFIEIKTTVGSKTSSAVSAQMSAGMVAMTQEALTEFTPLKLDGPRVKLVDIMGTVEARELSTELALTFAEEIYTNPIYRAGAFLVNSIAQVHKINTMETPPGAAQQQQQQPSAPQTSAPVPVGDGKKDTNGFEMPQGK